MAAYSYTGLQLVPFGQNALFNETVVPCNRRFVLHREGSGSFILRGVVPVNYSCPCQETDAQYLITFGANIQVPTGGTAGEISLSLALNGEVLPESTVIVTPTVAEAFFNVERTMIVSIPRGCCQDIAIENTSSTNQTIGVQNLNINITRPDMLVSR